jgi:opioid growth factor receptor-like protein
MRDAGRGRGIVAAVADPIVAFYQGGRDAEGRTLADILSWDDDRLEAVHDYIQWVFPTRQPSGVNRLAPLVTDATAAAFAGDVALRDRLRLALDRMLAFYGLRRKVRRIEIDPSRLALRSRVWLRPGNHNHLRLTRIMQSLAALGVGDDARALQRCLLEDVCGGPEGDNVSRRTQGFWTNALTGP